MNISEFSSIILGYTGEWGTEKCLKAKLFLHNKLEAGRGVHLLSHWPTLLTMQGKIHVTADNSVGTCRMGLLVTDIIGFHVLMCFSNLVSHFTPICKEK